MYFSKRFTLRCYSQNTFSIWWKLLFHQAISNNLIFECVIHVICISFELKFFTFLFISLLLQYANMMVRQFVNLHLPLKFWSLSHTWCWQSILLLTSSSICFEETDFAKFLWRYSSKANGLELKEDISNLQLATEWRSK